jgi:hypothetical protein
VSVRAVVGVSVFVWIAQGCSSADPVVAAPAASTPDAGSTAGDAGDAADSAPSATCAATKASVRFGTAEATSIESDEVWGIRVFGTDLLFVGQQREVPPMGSAAINRIHFGRLDAARQPVWRKTFGEQNQVARAFEVDTAGGMVVVGSFTGTLNLGGTDLVGQSSNPAAPTAFVARYDRSDGTHRFSVPVGAGNGVEATVVTADGAGNAWVGGTFVATASFGATQLTSQGVQDIFLARLDPSGNVLAAFRRGGDGDDTISAIAIDPTSGDLLIGGRSGSAGFVAKIAPTGEERWTTPIVGTRDGGASALVLDAVGDVYVAGAIDRRPIVLRLDANGKEKWRKADGVVTNEQGGSGANAIAIAADGAVLAGGSLDPGARIDFGGGPLAIAMDQPVGSFIVELSSAPTARTDAAASSRRRTTRLRPKVAWPSRGVGFARSATSGPRPTS